MQNSIKVTLIVCATVLIVALLGFFLFKSFLPTYTDTVNVQGSGVVKAVPDLYTVYYSIDTIGTTSKEAKEKNDELLEKLNSELISKGFSSDVLKVQSFNIYENVEWINGQSVNKGFKATQSLKIELGTDEKDKISDAIDAGVNAGVLINSINFELSPEKESQAKAEAINKASDDAKVKVEAVAQGFGKKVGKLVSVSVDEYYYNPRVLYANAGGAMDQEVGLAKDATTNLVPADQDVTARVSAVFRLR